MARATSRSRCPAWEPTRLAATRTSRRIRVFFEAVADKTWFGPIEFRSGSEPYMTIAMAHVGHDAGVTFADVNLKLIWDVISAIHVGETGYAFVVGSDGHLIAHPDLSLVLRETDFSNLPQVKQALAVATAEEPAESGSMSPRVGMAEFCDARR